MTPLLDAAPGYRARHTLPLRVEAVRQLKRRRTYVMGAVLAALPFVLIAAFAIGGDDRDGPDNRITLMDTATASGLNFAATCLFVSAGFLLVIPVALFCGDTVASEAGWSSLRYLLAAPVPRARLLWSKLAVALGFSAAAMVLLPVVALAAGTVAYGWGPLRLPAGGALAAGDGVARLAVAVAFVFVSQLVTAGLAFWLSTRTDAPLGAVGGAVGLTIVGNVLDAVTALGDWRDLLPAHWQYAWIDALQPHLEWSGMAKGAAVSTGYALVLFALAFRGFARKDIVS
ncbi:ABC transporter permease [Streptomyces sp. CC228A]|uniref:ABC transporter permease n=1 Tax=Streptomyces sp. CC228A TaxID=2898186 RepID=UPI001F48D24E|nr:ABC transporter permease [Streptomyces sp. CC228A]